ncbi:hypothetical protein [Flindersiella endophytica]
MVRLAPARKQLVIAAAAAAAFGGMVAAAPSANAATQLTASNFRLQKTADSPVIAGLDALLPNVSVPTVVGDGNRVATRCTPSASNVVIGFCWNSGDAGTPDWYPQGVTTTADAYTEGTYEGSTAVVVSWYDHLEDSIDKGVRLSFVDWSNTASPTYRHVLLVEPYTDSAGRPNFRPVNVHAGGMFWYGYYLYVADTSNGFRVFDLRHLWQVTTGNESLIGRQPDGTYQAFNYKYVLPQSFRYLRSTAGGYTNLTFSFASLDRSSTPDSVVVGEYANPGSGTRLVRFPIDYTNRLLTTSSDGYAHGTQAYQVDVTSMQGAVSINNKYLLSTSDGDSNKGDLGEFTPGGSVVMNTDVLAIGPEDFSYWPDRGQVWTASEHPNQRNVYAFRASAY